MFVVPALNIFSIIDLKGKKSYTILKKVHIGKDEKEHVSPTMKVNYN